MFFNKIKGFSIKTLGIICAIALLISVIYVPLSFGASAAAIPVAEDETVLFTFSDEEGSVTGTGDPNNLTRGDDGIGCVGWGPIIYTGTTFPQRYNTLSVKHTNPVNYGDSGGYRLNNNDGVYYLEASSTYVVSFKFKMVSVALNTASITAPKNNYLNLGYGFVGGTTGNTCSGMKTVVSKVFSADSVIDTKKNEAKYTITTMMGDRTVQVSDEWIELTYVFATPENLGEGSPALGFYSTANYGLEFYIDDVAVTKIGSDKGTIVLIDEYSDSFSYITGEADTDAVLPTPEANDPAHEFKGWFKDADRTESAEGIKYTSGVTTLYSAWKAPVSITFIDTLNGGEPYVVTGVAGEKIVYPEEPVDEQSEPDSQWFMGWYTTEGYTEEFVENKFGYSSRNVYSKWMGEIAEQVEDFENYTQDNRYTQTTADGIRYGNRHVFGVAMQKIDDPTGNEKGKVAGLNWRGGITLDPNDPSTYKSHERYTSALDNVIVLNSLSLIKGTTYTLSFDYYAENMTDTQKVSIFPYVTTAGSVWGGNSVNYRTTQGTEVVLTKDNIDGSWHKGEMTFTAELVADTAKTLYLLFGISENTDTVVYVDNVTLSAVQPYESMVIYKHNNGKEDKIIRGNRGEAISEYIPVFKNFEFLGWYTDEALTVPFTQNTFGRKTVVAYAKWPALPITFEDYKWAYKSAADDRFRFGSRMNIINETGIGVDGDDYLLDFKLVGDDVKEVAADGKTTYWRERATSARDHIAQLGTVENNKLYKVTYYYRAMSDNNVELQINFSNGNGTTIWGGAYTNYATTAQKVAKDNTEWTKAETYISTSFTSQYSNVLYLQVCTTASSSTTGMVLHAQFDNITVEKIEAPYIYFDGLNKKPAQVVRGKAGEKIAIPEDPALLGNNFVGWYLDKELTVPFTATHFEGDEELIVYAKYELADYVLYDFEDYNLTNNPGWYVYGNGGKGTHDGVAYSGTGSIELDRDTSNPKYYYATYAAIGYGNGRDIFVVEPNRVYVLTYKYYIARPATKTAKLYFAGAHSTSYHHNTTTFGHTLSIPISEEVGVWHEGTVIVDGTKLKDPTCNSLFVAMTGGNDGLYYIDDVALTRLPEGHTAYIVDNGGCKGVPTYVTGPIGSSFAKFLPAEPKFDNHYFGGYIYYDASNNSAELLRDKMVFTEDTIRIVANFVRINTVQDFEKGFDALLGTYGDYTTIDFDYEHYDSSAEGNSKDNVTSGRYSLHRKGKSMYFENAQVLTQDKTLTPGERYTVTMKVKLGKCLQKDGAIKIASNNNAFYPWAVTGDYLAVAAIADLKENEWQEVSFTYVATEPYLSIQTPGYVELFIDDISIVRVDASTSVSQAVSFTEYVPAKRDANGNLVDGSVWEAEVFTLVSGEAGGNAKLPLGLIIGGGAGILVVAALVVLLIVLKKRKAVVSGKDGKLQ